MMSTTLGVLSALSLAALFATVTPAHAAVFTVDTTVDNPALTACDDATPNDCSLRGAIIKANGLTEPTTINVPAGTYLLTQSNICQFADPASGRYTLNPKSLCLTGNVTLQGAGSATTIIDGNNPVGTTGVAAPVVIVSGGADVEFDGLALIHGNFTTSAFWGYGGAVRNAGTLRLVDTVVRDSTTNGPGGGIYNTGALTLVGSVVMRNTTQLNGAGIYNSGGGTIAVASSLISDNFAFSQGGGIFNWSGMARIDGSTITANSAQGGGGGLYNSRFNTMYVTNSTVSGNHAQVGGGIYNDQQFATLHLNNVTIANNLAQFFDGEHRGQGGGLINNTNGVITMRNTLIAGNTAFDLDPSGNILGPDCLAFAGSNAGITSEGFNLIQDGTHCDIVGDKTGNIIGQDPKLGALLDNGGPTPTRALGSGSPAINAGSPAVPGSGKPACAATDQRQFLRPIGAACDIGAVEQSGAFMLTRIVPNSGGNAGTVSVAIVGGGFQAGASVALHHAGQADVVATTSAVDIGGADIGVTFDLTGKSSGAWDVVVTNPDQSSRTLAGGFIVQQGGSPSVWIDAFGAIRGHGRTDTLTIVYGNRGNVDAIGVPVTLSIPQGISAKRRFLITPPPGQAGQPMLDWDFVPPIVADSQSAFLQLPLLLPVIPAGYTGQMRIQFSFPSTAPDTFILLGIDDPVFGSGVDPQFVAREVAGAQAYVQQNFGLTISAALLAAMRQYATNQLQAVIVNGRSAFVASTGTDPQIYSVTQLELDLAMFAASRAAGN